jgi:hypothetical protein
MDSRYRSHKKVPKSRHSRHPHKSAYLGNATSPACSRPRLIKSRRLFDKAENSDLIRHKAVDVVGNQPLYRKTGCPSFISYDRTPLNTQQHDTWRPKAHKVPQPKMVVLSELYQYLYLSNLDYAKQPDAELRKAGINYIINVSDQQLLTSIDHIDIEFCDRSNVSYKYFSSILNRIVTVLQQAIEQNRHILIHCVSGTNRSVSACIAYALRNGGGTVDDWIKYIEQQKMEKYEYWDTLTNETFRRYLMVISN